MLTMADTIPRMENRMKVTNEYVEEMAAAVIGVDPSEMDPEAWDVLKGLCRGYVEVTFRFAEPTSTEAAELYRGSGWDSDLAPNGRCDECGAPIDVDVFGGRFCPNELRTFTIPVEFIVKGASLENARARLLGRLTEDEAVVSWAPLDGGL